MSFKKELLSINFKIAEILESNGYSQKTISFIERSYTEKFRRYHTLYHINDLLTSLQKHYELSYNTKTQIPNKGVFNCLKIAIIFHDVFYRVGNQNNELNSAKLFELFTENDNIITLTKEEINLISEAIKSTKDHIIVPYNLISFWLIKLDLEGFSLPFEKNWELELKVQEEFSSHYTWEQYKEGKLKF